MGRLFISYARTDRRRVYRLVSCLQAAGHDVWLDTKDIKVGDQWRLAIAHAIQASRALILAMSPKSLASDNVRREVDVAVEAKLRIIPVELRKVAIPDELRIQLSGLQTVDLSAGFKMGLARLLEVLGTGRQVGDDARARRVRRLLLWTVSGAAVVAGMFVSIAGREAGSVLTAESVLAALLGGAVLGASLGWASTLFIKLLGWIWRLLWLTVAGALLGVVAAKALAWAEVIEPEGEVAYALAGILLALVLEQIRKRWRRFRMRARVAALVP